MRPDTFARLEDLFHRACELEAAEQRALLDLECAGDATLRQQIEGLLAAEDTRVERLEEAIHEGLDWVAESDRPQRIGPYRVLGELGRGGFSTVYLAQRDDGHFDMQVAIKRVHRHLRSPEVLRRLRRERQILANLDHPNIARILDGGSTDDGAPYVVMEYIEGQPIDRYCENRNPDLEAKLRLFRQACEAVQYAHRNLVLHRDLKPSNILVSDTGVVKLVDFGIAKLLQVDGEDTATSPDLLAVLTQPGGRALTPEYASPEQMMGRPLTVAADVYSLGVVLYVLISGQRPYAFEGRNWSDMERVVCEIVPPPLSQRVALEGKDRRRSAELDIIVAKALHKEPDRRYGSVEALAEDLRRHLEGLPIEARRDSFVYRARKFVLRHAAAVGFLSVLFLTLVAAVFVTRWQADKARRAQRHAEQQRTHAEHQTQRAEHVARFLEELFEDTDPYANTGRRLLAHEVVERGARRIHRELRHDLPLSAELMATMGRVYRRMALYDEAEELLTVALKTHRRQTGPPTPRHGDTLRDLAILFSDRGLCDRASANFQEAEQLFTSLGVDGDTGLATTLHYMGRNAKQCGEPELAEALIDRSLELDRRNLGPEAEKVVDSESLLAELWYANGDYDRAGPAFESVLAKRRQTLGAEHPKVAISLSDTAAVRQANGDPKAAVPLYLEALEIQRRGLGEHHFSVAQTLFNLAAAHASLRQWETAKGLFEQSLEITRQVYGDEHPWVADCFQELGHAHRNLDELEAAEAAYQRAFDLRLRLLGAEHHLVAQSQLSLAALTATQDPAEGLELYFEVLAAQERSLGSTDFRLSYTLIRIGRLLSKLERPEEAEPQLRRALELRQQSLSVDHWETGLAEYFLGQALKDLQRIDEARQQLQSSYDHLSASLGVEDSRTQRSLQALGALPAGEGQ